SSASSPGVEFVVEANDRYWRKPTVSLGVTYAVVCTYGCDDGRIAPTRCALIDAGLDGRCSPRRTCRTPPSVRGRRVTTSHSSGPGRLRSSCVCTVSFQQVSLIFQT